ncbi:MAG: glucose-6-phosphate isomerase [Alphaproteobacteria bacterium]|nr:glucose-6-phosphate isomerase [Alphaproteobacteria bacterium]MCB9698496.1 glucose-6-phosphate isomerase [Alphaproteobacteria bacterium]
MGFDEAAVDALPWAAAFRAMTDLEQGAIANADEERRVGHYWLRAPTLAPEVGLAQLITDTLDAVTGFAEGVRTGAVLAEGGERFTDVLHVGIGGSALGPQLLIDALVEPGAGLRLHFLDNTDPDGIERVLSRLGEALRTTLVIVVSKSGGTPETANGMKLVVQRLRERGLEVGSRMVAITGEGSALDRQATSEGWLRRFPLWDWVGGRTSVTSAVGLLPAALAGLDVGAFLRGAAEMDAWTRATAWRDNPAALLAASWFLVGHGHGERAMVVLPYADRLLLMSRYLQQLVMESLGKRLDRRGREVLQGLTVYGNKGSTDQHAFVQQLRDGRNDFFAVFVQVLGDGHGSDHEVDPGVRAGDYLQGFLLGTRRALASEDRRNLTITLPEVNAGTVGGLVALFERAVGLYAELVDINAYHQPGVEAGKRAAKEILTLSERIRGALGAPRSTAELAATLSADELEVFYVLEHLVATGRARREGHGRSAVYGSAS